MAEDRIGVLFVCLGNICRSPLAEGVFRALVEEAGLADRFRIDSAGTSGWHDGERPDARTTAVARARGVEVSGTSRRVTDADFRAFHHIVAMDKDNLRELRRIAEKEVTGVAELNRLRDFDPAADGKRDVPDPYFGGTRGFEDVHDIVVRSCLGLLEHLRNRHGL